ncbi:hypothetical protein OLX02_11760 [Novosphingobium sp. KCTC 2891]|uniref:hypothetical protein n=1 Tax=Novosphingobium sp. KCTC 2891 TaxID=2989730 RepID=UPI0022235C71|nr:hypothetical protein [Novosphingobium sp. KCTC 2891]MCW1383495.1 hypothetical protein [Novosphingobium sp. KCTC 2891]
MNRILIGALTALLLVAAGVFWWEGRAATERAAPAPSLALAPATESADEEELPEADPGEAVGPALPQASEQSREQRRFDRLDKDRDSRITRNEMLSPRVKDFRKLDVDGNNLLTFEEWAATSSNRFKAADANGDLWLSRDEYATTKAKAKKPACKCR